MCCIAYASQWGQGSLEWALGFLDQPRLEAVSATYTSLLRWCGKIKDLLEGKRLHELIVKGGFEHNRSIGNLLLQMYGSCGALEEARSLFYKMHQHDLFSWNVFIKAHALDEKCKEALQIFLQMQQEGVMPNNIILISILSACANQASLKEGKRMHARLSSKGDELDVAVGTALIIMYGKCGYLEHAQIILDKMHERDLVLWSAMIATYARHRHGKNALKLFDQMQQEGSMPDLVTFVSVLDACSDYGSLVESKQMHTRILGTGFEANVVVGTALVNMYGKCGSLVDAQETFNKMQDRNLVSWNALIASHSCNGRSKDALQFFERMQQESIMPNSVTFISTIDSCASSSALVEGKKLHACISSNVVELDIVVGTALVNMYGKCGRFQDAHRIYDTMPEYDNVTFVSVLSVCANCAALNEGKQIHGWIVAFQFESDVVVGTALIHMYSKCGCLKDARKVFDKMIERNIVSWNAMIAAYAQNGLGKESLFLFNKMQKEHVKPDAATFVSVLSACSHVGLLDEGCRYFRGMKQDYDIIPNEDHYNCMIDLLGRMGLLVEAEELIVNMPFEPSVVSWTTLLSACRKQVDVKRGEHAACRIFELNPKDVVPYVMLANTYVAAGMGDEATKVINMMRDRGLKRQSGHSLIEVNGRVNEFVVNDQLHPQKEEIYAELKRWCTLIDTASSAAGTNIMLHSLEEIDHKLCSHSELLAVAFGLISTRSRTPLLISKNLEVCPDCHSFIKLISKMASREIIMRDSNRIHHMTNGLCSCSDYW